MSGRALALTTAGVLVGVVAVAALVARPGESASAPAPLSVVTAQVDGALPLRVEVADSPEAVEQGLSGRVSVPAGSGMVLVFGDGQDAALWMHRTLVPLQVAWVHDGRVVEVAEMHPCRSGLWARCPVHRPQAPASAAIEAPLGSFDDVSPGAPVTLSPPVPGLSAGA